MQTQSVPIRTFSNSLFISVMSGFENFLRSFLTGILKEIQNRNSVPESLIYKNLQLSGVALSYYYSPTSYQKHDYSRMAKNLNSCFNDDEQTILNEEIIFYLKSILELENVFSFLEHCGIRITWDNFSEKNEIKEFFDTTNPRETGKMLKGQLNDYLDMRNRIAHTGLSSSDMALNKVEEAILCLTYVAEFLTDFCVAEINK
nr:HEPN domain-containing protein [Maribellus sediminis]